MVRAFRKADALRKRRENTNAWLNGLYVYEAVGVALSSMFSKRKNEYPKAPHELEDEAGRTEEEKKQIEENERIKATLFFQNWARSVAKNMEQKGGR